MQLEKNIYMTYSRRYNGTRNINFKEIKKERFFIC